MLSCSIESIRCSATLSSSTVRPSCFRGSAPEGRSVRSRLISWVEGPRLCTWITTRPAGTAGRESFSLKSCMVTSIRSTGADAASAEEPAHRAASRPSATTSTAVGPARARERPRFFVPSTSRVSGKAASALSGFIRSWWRHHRVLTRGVDRFGVVPGQNGGDMERGTIVVVDDEPNIADLVGMYLEREGFRVLQAATGTAGLQAFNDHRPRLVVLDVGLPDLDGLEVCKRIRQTSQVPIIFLTA